MTATLAAPPVDRLAAVTPTLRQVADLKRVRVAHADGSAAERAFSRAWASLVDGADPAVVADRECAAAVAGARLGGVDAATLSACGLTGREVEEVLGRAVDEVVGSLHPDTARRIWAALPDLVLHGTSNVAVPSFVTALRRQPRAGATAAGRPRLVVEPAENHAEHCWAVAVYGALLADDTGADPAEAFLLGLAHHLHNARLPDAGFAGEVLLGAHLEPVIDRLTERELAELPDLLAARVTEVLAARADAETPLGRTFHAADVLDRVLQVHHHARAAAFTAEQALVDLALVHDGPVVDYHRAVLRAAGL
ncbi:HD domain-containing protein [Micromonospora sp. WMMD1120]|uniref:HD domain-containing protein n=1 Tax=Micromonospora sp. WMMD1120 TaxID=3016106 RepID=UPI002417D1FC|nr:HD domain-containing protein [Micromonospora sp. WMMD1120]MDG4811015.1 HD domain-containing protein [Micromonospora sp. WMMD1120]